METRTENIQSQYRESGYFLARNFFSSIETQELEAAVMTARERAPSTLNKEGLLFRAHLFSGSPFLQRFLSQPKIVELMKNFVGSDFWIRKDQAVVKKPGGVEFAWHQDNGYNGIQDGYHQLWIPLTAMNPKNGGLFIIPESHRRGILPHEFREEHYAWRGDDSSAIAIHAERGDVLVFSSLLLHKTGQNQTGQDRTACVVEFMSTEHFDPDAKPPYFLVARGGEPDPRFVRTYKGESRLQNRLKYVLPAVRRHFSVWKGRLGKWLKRPFTS